MTSPRSAASGRAASGRAASGRAASGRAASGRAISGRAGRGRYHHGDLRAALIETTIELLGERGVQAFSMAEASRRLGVAVAAPYRHFADRDALLAAVAVRAAELLGQRLYREAASGTPAQRLAAAARAYVRFASDQRPLFQALVGSGLDKSRHPEIDRAAQAVGRAFASPAAELAGEDGTAAARLTSAIVATAHGHAVLLLDGTFGSGDQAVELAAGQAAAATLALIAGRENLTARVPGRDRARRPEDAAGQLRSGGARTARPHGGAPGGGPGGTA